MLSTLLIIGLFVMSAHANAAIDATSIDNMIEKFQTAASTWQAPLLNYATNLFWILAFIQFSWAMIGLAFRGDDLSIWASTIVNQIMYVGFMSWLLMNSATFAEAIVNSFRQAASTASFLNGVCRPELFLALVWLWLLFLNGVCRPELDKRQK